MLKHEATNGAQTHVCPSCGKRLAQEGDLWACEQHGAFFAYGPHLLVRAPDQRTRLQDTPMPWEGSPAARAR